MKDNNIKQALKGTSIIAGAQVFQIFFGIIRTKIIAILLGPGGVGISGLYQSVIQLTTSIFSLGISQSIVKSVAATDENSKRERLINSSVLLTLILGLIAIIVSVIFSNKISLYTFNTTEYGPGIAILSACVLLNMIFANLLGVVQGLRMLKKIALINIYSSASGLFVSAPVYYLFGINGIIIALIFISFSNLIISVVLIRPTINFYFPQFTDFKDDVVDLMKLGIALALSGLFIALSGYFIRIYVTDMHGLDGVGLLNAATTISTLYLSLIFTAMGTDFYPKLASISNDNFQINKNVNDQILISLLIAGPIIAAFIFFSELIIQILYSNKFISATPLLQWQLLGTLIKTFLWPIGFIVLAKGLPRIFIVTELFFNLSYCALTFIFWKYFQLASIGVSFFLSYVLLTIILLLIVKKESSFIPRSDVLKVMFVFLFSSSAIIITLTIADNTIIRNVISVFFILFCTFFSYWRLKKLINFNEFYSWLISKIRTIRTK